MQTLQADYASYTENNPQYKLQPGRDNAEDRHSQAGTLRGRNAEIDREMQKETVRKGFNNKQ